MKKCYIIILLLLCFGFNQSIFAQSTNYDELSRKYGLNNHLTGLTQVQVLVEGLNPILQSAGLTKQLLENEVELRLRRVRIFREKDDRNTKKTEYDFVINNNTGNAYLYVNVNGIEINNSAISYSIRISLDQSVFLARNKEISTTASTWDKGVIGIVDKSRASSVIRESVAELVDVFIKDWKEVNKKSSSKKEEIGPPPKMPQDNSPFKAVYVGGNRPPEVEVFNDSDRTLYLDLGQTTLTP